jgi:hypothetical protein
MNDILNEINENNTLNGKMKEFKEKLSNPFKTLMEFKRKEDAVNVLYLTMDSLVRRMSTILGNEMRTPVSYYAGSYVDRKNMKGIFFGAFNKETNPEESFKDLIIEERVNTGKNKSNKDIKKFKVTSIDSFVETNIVKKIETNSVTNVVKIPITIYIVNLEEGEFGDENKLYPTLVSGVERSFINSSRAGKLLLNDAKEKIKLSTITLSQVFITKNKQEYKNNFNINSEYSKNFIKQFLEEQYLEQNIVFDDLENDYFKYSKLKMTESEQNDIDELVYNAKKELRKVCPVKLK